MTASPSTVAVVDDESSVCRALSRLLRSVGLEVVTFTEGAAFLKFLESQRPDCIVLDLHMPQVSGFDVLAWLVKQARPIPVVTITGHDTPESYQRVMAAGACAYLRKPPECQILVDSVVSAIEKAKA